MTEKKAGIQSLILEITRLRLKKGLWIPACAGTTGQGGRLSPHFFSNTFPFHEFIVVESAWAMVFTSWPAISVGSTSRPTEL